jgi:molecular chaperone DnaK (HSP70)
MCPLAVGLNGPGGAVRKVAFRGANLPLQEIVYFDYGTNNTPRLTFSVYQGERVLQKDNRLLTSFTVRLPPASAGEILIAVTMTLDRTGNIAIAVSGSLPATGRDENNLNIDLESQANVDLNEYSVLELAHMYSVAEASYSEDMAEMETAMRRERIQSYYDNLCGFFRGAGRDPVVEVYVPQFQADSFLADLNRLRECEIGRVPSWDVIAQVKAQAREMLRLYFENERPEGPPAWMR